MLNNKPLVAECVAVHVLPPSLDFAIISSAPQTHIVLPCAVMKRGREGSVTLLHADAVSVVAVATNKAAATIATFRIFTPHLPVRTRASYNSVHHRVSSVRSNSVR